MTHSHSVQTDSQNTIPDLIRRVHWEPGFFIDRLVVLWFIHVQVMSSAVDVITLVSNIILVV